VAATIGEQYTARSLSFRCVPTYRLDGPVVIGYDGAKWLLSSWDMPLTPGADMSVSCEEYIQ
jgi:hypothetical protein